MEWRGSTSRKRFSGTKPHPRWFETDLRAIGEELHLLINSIGPAEILAALPPPSIAGVSSQSPGGTLSFYRPQSKWLEYPGITVLPFSNYEQCIRNLVSRFGGAEHLLDLPHLNATQAEPSQLTPDQRAMVQTFYEPDMVYEARVIAL